MATDPGQRCHPFCCLTFLVCAASLFVCVPQTYVAAQTQTGTQTAPAQRTMQIMAIVNGQQITRDQLSRECVRKFGEPVLESVINNYLISNECRRRGVIVSANDIEMELDKRAKQFGFSVERYINLIRSERNVSAEKLRNEIIWTEIALRRLAASQIQVSAEEVAQRLETEFGPKVQVRAIALETEQKAGQVLALARQDPENFGRLAKDHSVDPNSASMKGLLPPIRRNVGNPDFEAAAFSLQAGQISEVLPMNGQFIILKCERTFDATPLEPQQQALVEERINQQLREEKLSTAAAALFKEMQETTEIINVYNDEQLRQQMPGVAATVGGNPITMQEVREECIARFGRDVLDAEINRIVILQALKKFNLTVSDADLQQEIRRAAESFGFTNDEGFPDIEKWIAYVTKNDASQTEVYVQDEVWPSVALKKLVQSTVQVTDEDMRKGWEANFGPRVEALIIMLEDQRSAQKIWQMAKANPTEQHFGELAHQYSVEPASRANYGEVPPIQKHGGRPLLEQEAFKMQPGEISGLIPLGENWVILWCKGRTTPAVQDFDAVKDELYKDILEKKMRIAMAERFEQLQEAAQIDNFMAGTSQPGRSAVPGGQLPPQNPIRGQAPNQRGR